MAKKKRNKLQQIRAAPLPPPGSTGAAPGGGSASGQGKSTASGTSGSGGSYDPGPGAKVVHKAGDALKTTALDAGKGTARYAAGKAAQQVHQKFSEAERDNAALESAHEAERIGENLARAGLRKGTKLVREQFAKRGVGKKPPPANLGKARQAATAPTPIIPGAARLPGTTQPALPPPGKVNPAATRPGTAVIVPTVQPPGTALPPATASSKFRPGAAPNAPPQFTLHHVPPGSGSTLRDLWNTPAARFGTHVDFSEPKPGLIGKTLRAGKDMGLGALKMGADRAALQLRGKLDQAADDNSAFKAAHRAEQLAERPVGYALKKGEKAVTAPIKRAANEVRSKLRHRFLVRKQAYLRKHPSFAEARGVMMKAKALARELVRNAKPVLVGLGACLAIYFFCSMIVGPIAAVMSKAGTEYLATTTYPVANQDITGSTVQWTELQMALELRIENIETEFPDFNEYRYDVEEMEQYPFELISYLAAMHLEFTHPSVQAEIAEIFGEVNALQLVPETEIRYDANGEPYEWKILNIILHPKPFEEVVTPRLEAANAKDLYDAYMGSGGNQQAFGNPFTFNWSASITSYYGNRPNPTGDGYEFHTGLDIAASAGTPIRSLQDGYVVVSGWHDLYGNYIVIRDENGISTLYAHCSALYGSVGDAVRQGQIIAAVGSTGNTTGNHLHVEIKLGDERVDPLFYIQNYNET